MDLKLTPKQLVVVIFRLLAGLPALVSPFWGFAFSYFADTIDVVILYFLRAEKMSDRKYHLLDKLLDDYMIILGVIGAVTHGVFFGDFLTLMWAAFIIRMAGTIIVYVTNWRLVLLFTPNFITWYLLVFGFMYWKQDYGILQNHNQTILLLLACLGISLCQELVIHVFRLQPAKRFTDLMTRLGL